MPTQSRGHGAAIYLHRPGQALIEPGAEGEVVAGVDLAIAVEVQERHITAADRLVEGAPEGEVVVAGENGREIVARLRRGIGVAKETMEYRRQVRGHVH